MPRQKHVHRVRSAAARRYGRDERFGRLRARHRARDALESWAARAQRQRTDALLTDRVAFHVESTTPRERLVGIQNRAKAAGRADVAEWRLKETRPHGAVGLDHTRHPRRVALIRRKCGVAVQRGVVLLEANAEFIRGFGDEP